ncbi:MAG: hypothetical protein KIT74_05015 [Fimbriimonadales bacterium]|nr:hypothetical protein [Fimbriimonadales bacterium]
MRRFNSEAIDREDLILAFRKGDPVRLAKAKGHCMLCKGSPVNDAGLCEGCFANLTDEEWNEARHWIEGRIA